MPRSSNVFVEPADRYDVVIIGGGIAGLTAATVLGRACRRVAVVDAGQPRNGPADQVHGFPSRDGISPAELVRLCRSDLEQYDVELVSGQVIRVNEDRQAELADGRVLQGRHLLLATGLRDTLPDIAGARERWGRDLLHCPYCHGWEMRNQALAILGTGQSSVQQSILVRSFSAEVTLIVQDGLELSGDDVRSLEAMGVDIVEGAAQRLLIREDALDAVVLADGRTVPCRALFCEPVATVDPALADIPGCTLDADGCLETDDNGRTGADRIWAVGNVTDPSGQVVPVAGDAYRLAVALNAQLLEEDTEAALSGGERAAASL
ncbi:NAD(P)/FAD-dependent oxidoreductase [Arthrobacter sunyaminii]|uniref:NAD(P)/FAD-dependent oxidoreductase n=1 Tax=Arthrobacter sunyaminii TaxID=2816859 RepID=A0A975PFT1_9MICC|nr:NAD(P)/FAD-dependent oxidoreductase [Arthrobacter sunyaminii]MBO0908476.1 NAD(P)/FAD-dependent oxidoreductase [Arthrobacter sunyaminii]QWQ35977.1 NAD(P)/FAD-dependent oxidoreductase [Arthrobacter sunyaminii]